MGDNSCPNCRKTIQRHDEHVIRVQTREAPTEYSCRREPLTIAQTYPDVVAQHFAAKRYDASKHPGYIGPKPPEASQFEVPVTYDKEPCPLCHNLMTWTARHKPMSYDWCPGCQERATQLLTEDSHEGRLFRSKIVTGHAATLFEMRRLIVFPRLHTRGDGHE